MCRQAPPPAAAGAGRRAHCRCPRPRREPQGHSGGGGWQRLRSGHVGTRARLPANRFHGALRCLCICIQYCTANILRYCFHKCDIHIIAKSGETIWQTRPVVVGKFARGGAGGVAAAPAQWLDSGARPPPSSSPCWFRVSHHHGRFCGRGINHCSGERQLEAPDPHVSQRPANAHTHHHPLALPHDARCHGDCMAERHTWLSPLPPAAPKMHAVDP